MNEELYAQLNQFVELLIEQNKVLKADKITLEHQLAEAQNQYALSQRELNELHQLQQTFHTSLNKPRIKAQSMG